MAAPVPPLLRRISTDEFVAPRWNPLDEIAVAQIADAEPAGDRCDTARSLRAIDAAWGGGWFDVAEAAEHDEEVAAAVFAGRDPVIDVQTHLVDANRWVGASAAALGAFLNLVDPTRWSGPVDPRRIGAAAWASLVFGTSETAIAVLTSTPGPADANVLTNPQIAAAREIVERYSGSERLLTHAIVHPNLEQIEHPEHLAELSARLRPSGWKCYTLYGPPSAAAPDGGWYLDDPVVGIPFLEAVRAVGPNIVAAHKGLGGPVAGASLPAASPRDIGPAAAMFTDIDFLVYHSGYEIDSDRLEGAFDPMTPRGVDRLIASVADAGLGPGANVYAELGSTWFLMLRRPLEAAHVLGKLLLALGPDRILWGTDSTWYGSPQPLIDAFRAFQIPDWMQEEFGYPALTADVKARILGGNASRVYGIDPTTLESAGADRDRTWVPELASTLTATLEQQRR
jgi:predicted TIM-barrel fold metal-dependent hydrolase